MEAKFLSTQLTSPACLPRAQIGGSNQTASLLLLKLTDAADVSCSTSRPRILRTVALPTRSRKSLRRWPDPRAPRISIPRAEVWRRLALAVAEYYRGRASVFPGSIKPVDPDRIFLTSSTSEAYTYVFRLLCEVGDEVLVPAPSYPLFEFLADLADIRLVSYPLLYDHGWQMDLKVISRQRSRHDLARFSWCIRIIPRGRS